MRKITRTYLASFGLKHGVKQCCERHEMQVDCSSAREAIGIVRSEVLNRYGRHAFRCKALMVWRCQRSNLNLRYPVAR